MNKKIISIAIVLILASIVVSYYLFPSWGSDWKAFFVLIVTVIVGVTSFIANWRQAFQKDETKENLPAETGNKEALSKESQDVIEQVMKLIESPSIKFSGNAPPTPHLLIGRKQDIAKIKSFFGDSSHKDKKLLVVKGWPGVGKTTLTYYLAHQEDIRVQYPHGILWASLGQKPDVVSELSLWGNLLGIDNIKKAKSIQEIMSYLSAYLQDKRFFLIIDDVWRQEDAIPFLVGGIGCGAIITTRLDEVASQLMPNPIQVYTLDVLKTKEALLLLKNLAPTVVKNYPDECKTLVEELEGLPLALMVAGRLLNSQAKAGLKVIELIKELREGAILLESPPPADRIEIVRETNPTIASLLMKSVDMLDDYTKECFAYLGAFMPKPAIFGEEELKSIWQTEDPSFVIKKLVDHGLIEHLEDLNGYWMHSLLVKLASYMLEK